MRNYTAKQINEAIGIPLDKWKRWAREFVGIDPAAGRHGGVARKFDIDQIFHVYLGGWLVSDLQYSIPESKGIVTDLKPWLKARGLWPECQARKMNDAWDLVTLCRITIYAMEGTPPFAYSAFGKVKEETVKHKGFGMRQMLFVVRYIEAGYEDLIESKTMNSFNKTLEISKIKDMFDVRMGLVPEM